MRASVERSWRLLSEEERRLFERLSLFRGGFRREAAEEVADATSEALSALLRGSLLRWDEASGRFTIHDLLRQFGEEKLRERNGAFAAARRASAASSRGSSRKRKASCRAATWRVPSQWPRTSTTSAPRGAGRSSPGISSHWRRPCRDSGGLRDPGLVSGS